MSNDWSYGTFGCLGDCRICIFSFCLPCVQVGRNAEYFGEDCLTAACMNLCCMFPYEIISRNRLRHLRNIKGSMTMDIMCLMCCPWCSLAQDAREIEEAKKAGLPSGDTTVTATVVHTSMARE